MAAPFVKYALLVAIVALAVPAFIYKDSTKAVLDGAHELVSRLGIYAYPIWIVLHALSIVVCFPGTFAFEGAAGVLFGVVKGSSAVLAAKMVGASMAFWLGKTLLRDQVKAYVRSYPKFQVVVHGVRRDGWWFVLLARLSPIPSWVNNYGLAAVDVRFFPDYILASCAGTIPFILLNTYFGYLAEQGLSRTEIDDNHKWAHYALPGLGFTTAAGLFWKLTTYAQHYQQTLETLPSENEVEDTASEVVFLNEDISVGPAGGLRSRTKAGEEVTFSPDLGLVASPLKKGRGRKKEEGEVVEQEKKVVEIHLKEEDEEVQLTKVVAKIEPAAEQELASPRRRGRPRKSTTSPSNIRTSAKTTVTSPTTTPSRRRPGRPRKFEEFQAL